MRRNFIIILFSFYVCCLSQQDPQIALSVLNKAITNPAYLVESNYINLYTFYRQQWSGGVEKAPNTIYGGISVPLHSYNSTVGAKFMYDKPGFETKTAFYLTGAYFYKINEGKDGAISIGTELGILQNSIDGNLKLGNNTTMLNFDAAKVFDASLGIAYFCKYYHLGFSVSHINFPVLKMKYDNATTNMSLVNHYYLSAGTEQEIIKNIILKPYFKLKSDIAAWQYEISTVAEYYNIVSGGFEYRDDAFCLIFGLNTSWGIKLYGCYEINTSDISKNNSNSMEFFITYEFNIKNKFNKKIKINRFL